MEKIEYKFSIKRILRADQDEYIESIKIYNDTTPAEIKTKPDEIAYWLSNKDKSIHFEILLFALYINDKIIGFSMMTYLVNQQTLVIEYISLSNQYRVNTVFFSFINLMQNYAIEKNYNANYYIVEISNKNNGKSIDKESRIFKKLICLEDFAKVDAIYYTLPLGTDYESSFEAQLYIKSNDKINSIKKDTYLRIVESIYKDYSLKWYEPFLNSAELQDYKLKLDNSIELIKKNISDKNMIAIIYSDCPILDNINYDKTSGHIPSKIKNKKSVYPIIILTILVMPILLVWIYNYLLQLIDIQLSSASAIVGMVSSASLTSLFAWLLSNKKL